MLLLPLPSWNQPDTKQLHPLFLIIIGVSRKVNRFDRQVAQNLAYFKNTKKNNL